MPVMDGCEATSRIRSLADPYFQNIPILAYTGSSIADSKEKAEKLGMNDFVSKPLNVADMHFKISQYLLPMTLDGRPLRLKLDLYADNDPEFQRDLVLLMITNLRELQQASYKAYYADDVRALQTVVHKVKSTLILLDDMEYSYIVDDLKQSFLHGEKNDDVYEKINHFNTFTESIIKTLNQEVDRLTEAS
jgi:CheY-like chemotaxis protein